MGYKNPKELLHAMTALPAKIEAKLPVGAPKISAMLTDVTNKLPVMPDFIGGIELPALPEVPELPGPTPASAGIVDVTPTGAPAQAGRGTVKFVFE